MRRVSPPSSDIELYKDGFTGRDLLNRSEVGKNLTSLLDDVDEPIVIALDGTWGSGKSFFLKCWLGSHINDFNGKSGIVYLDAFAEDFLRDPLLSLVSCLDERFEADEVRSSLDGLKRATFKLALPAARVTAAALTAGISEITGPIIDAIVQRSESELNEAISSAWRVENTRKKAIVDFRQALRDVVNTFEGGNLIFVIDELDRCRPDYAIEMLEVAKHFFGIPKVHFVLGVNLDELENSVRVRYGLATNATSYLQKHISLTFSLPTEVARPDARKNCTAADYFQRQSIAMEIDPEYADLIADLINNLKTQPSLRDVDTILRVAGLARFDGVEFKRYYFGYKSAIATMTIFKAIHGRLYDRTLRGEDTLDELLQILNLTNTSEIYPNRKYVGIMQSLAGFINPEKANKEQGYSQLFDFGEAPRKGALGDLLANVFERFRGFQ